MRRVHLLMLIVLGILGALAGVVVWMLGPPDAERLVAEFVPEAKKGGPAEGTPASPPDALPTTPRLEAREPAAPTDDPEMLAAWFEGQVMRYLEDQERAPAPGDARRAAWSEEEAAAPIRIASARGPGAPEAGGAGWNPWEGSDHNVNWAYVDDVFEGRISGIPNETKAGISLQEMDELGDIPYLEQLRRERRYEELRDLGFENETVPWPACLRTKTCRRDSGSSPP
jgi:hypothetical protein